MAWLDLLCLLTQLFPEEMGPYSLDDIAHALHSAYEGEVNYHRVHYTWSRLYDDEETRPFVTPLQRRHRHYRFSAATARRIAKEVVGGELPPKMRAFQLASNSLQPTSPPPRKAPSRRVHRPSSLNRRPKSAA